MENHMNDGMVQLNKVTKAYGSFQLDCSMEVQPGMATGFVGANGAGKTTTFQILLGLVPPETGEIRIFGKPYTELTAKRPGADRGIPCGFGLQPVPYRPGCHRHSAESVYQI